MDEAKATRPRRRTVGYIQRPGGAKLLAERHAVTQYRLLENDPPDFKQGDFYHGDRRTFTPLPADLPTPLRDLLKRIAWAEFDGTGMDLIEAAGGEMRRADVIDVIRDRMHDCVRGGAYGGDELPADLSAEDRRLLYDWWLHAADARKVALLKEVFTSTSYVV